MKVKKVYTSLNRNDNKQDLLELILFTDKRLCEEVTDLFNEYNHKILDIVKNNPDRVRLRNSTLSYPHGEQTHSYVLKEDEDLHVIDTMEYVIKNAICKEYEAFVFKDYSDETSSHKMVMVDFGDGTANSNMAIQEYLESKGK